MLIYWNLQLRPLFKQIQRVIEHYQSLDKIKNTKEKYNKKLIFYSHVAQSKSNDMPINNRGRGSILQSVIGCCLGIYSWGQMSSGQLSIWKGWGPGGVSRVFALCPPHPAFMNFSQTSKHFFDVLFYWVQGVLYECLDQTRQRSLFDLYERKCRSYTQTAVIRCIQFSVLPSGSRYRLPR